MISPGPGTPEAAGQSIELVKYAAANQIPLLGVCLGHQAIAVAFGATVSRAPELLHGKTSEVHHTNKGVLSDLPSPFIATRYHSLAIEPETLPDELEVTGRTESGVVMSIETHIAADLWGAISSRICFNRAWTSNAWQLVRNLW